MTSLHVVEGEAHRSDVDPLDPLVEPRFQFAVSMRGGRKVYESDEGEEDCE